MGIYSFRLLCFAATREDVRAVVVVFWFIETIDDKSPSFREFKCQMVDELECLRAARVSLYYYYRYIYNNSLSWRFHGYSMKISIHNIVVVDWRTENRTLIYFLRLN